MTPSRRGFFATLAALPAVVMTKEVAPIEAAPLPPSTWWMPNDASLMFNPNGLPLRPPRAKWVQTEYGWRCESPGVIGDGDMVMDPRPPAARL